MTRVNQTTKLSVLWSQYRGYFDYYKWKCIGEIITLLYTEEGVLVLSITYDGYKSEFSAMQYKIQQYLFQ